MSAASNVLAHDPATEFDPLAVGECPRPRLRVSIETFYRLCPENTELRMERDEGGGLVVTAPAALESGFRSGLLGPTCVVVPGAGSCQTGLLPGFSLPSARVLVRADAWACPDTRRRKPPTGGR